MAKKYKKGKKKVQLKKRKNNSNKIKKELVCDFAGELVENVLEDIVDHPELVAPLLDTAGDVLEAVGDVLPDVIEAVSAAGVIEGVFGAIGGLIGLIFEGL